MKPTYEYLLKKLWYFKKKIHCMLFWNKNVCLVIYKTIPLIKILLYKEKKNNQSTSKYFVLFKWIYLFTYNRLVLDEFGDGMIKNVVIRGDRKRDQRSSNDSKKHLNLSVTATEQSGEAAIVIRRWPEQTRLDTSPSAGLVVLRTKQLLRHGNFQHRL